MKSHRVAAKDEWVAARRALLAKEKELTRLRDDLSRARRELPWERVDKAYVCEGRKGKETVADPVPGEGERE